MSRGRITAIVNQEVISADDAAELSRLYGELGSHHAAILWAERAVEIAATEGKSSAEIDNQITMLISLLNSFGDELSPITAIQLQILRIQNNRLIIFTKRFWHGLRSTAPRALGSLPVRIFRLAFALCGIYAPRTLFHDALRYLKRRISPR